MTRRYESHWEALARAVLTKTRAAFFAGGEETIADPLSRIDRARKRRIKARGALDFGCVAGRLTLPLARGAERVTGCHVSPTMLEFARGSAGEAGLRNVTFTPPRDRGSARATIRFHLFAARLSARPAGAVIIEKIGREPE